MSDVSVRAVVQPSPSEASPSETSAVSTSPRIVVLESGDRMAAVEFRRRYEEARPEIKKAELVEGVVYVASPVRAKVHGKPHGLVIGWLFAYEVRTSGVELAVEATVRLDPDNEVQPDALLWHTESGQLRDTEDGYLEGAPELVFEVAASSASYDLHDKLRAYRRNGVLEYVVWRTLDARIDWFRLRDGEYVRVEPDADGVIVSEAFRGLRLHVAKMLAGDGAGVLAELEQNSAESQRGPVELERESAK